MDLEGDDTRVAGVADVPVQSREIADAYPELFRTAFLVAHRILGDRGDAEDAAQEACARASLHWRRIRHPPAWVARVAGNVAVKNLKRRRRNAPAPAAPPPDKPELRIVLQDALASLSRRQREVIVLRFVADLPDSAVATTLGCTVGTVKQHSARGLAALRTALPDLGLPED